MSTKARGTIRDAAIASGGIAFWSAVLWLTGCIGDECAFAAAYWSGVNWAVTALVASVREAHESDTQ